ncbi:MAG: AAA domain-containing protein [Candidatus Aminicenantes bacterium]|nr:AAA domain-containing protein [Candidatus Aminicenantes bacterium]NIM79190.1 AAA domain-containing protein [Candidatus Aminicenantes bacterium]NIN20139.1 AAA domain-containing protein [Candidatus Aminicenantes bacterium]NIN42364.1 AAA domain-containing protein [Candidatus Aminicenantes bacterium]NIN85130.1 AAA domain-containing protein [Candidatus Aminicenantes bacterium]
MQKREIEELTSAIMTRVRLKMFGMDEVTRLILVAFYTGGHVLLEGNPGLGKTEMVKTLGQVLGLPYGRIQFTPDLMPADITGTYTPDFEQNQLQKLVFQKGPVFTSLLLADEINRATPKTQSAMLEAMAEKQVTVLGKKYPLFIPFMVLATQNPIDHEGTFNLPEAQADRFMFKINVPVPNNSTLRLILNKTAGTLTDSPGKKEADEAKLRVFRDIKTSKAVFERLEMDIQRFGSSPSVETHISNMFLASNHRFDELDGLTREQQNKARDLVEKLMVYGLGPRAATNLMLGAKAWSLMFLPGAESAEGPALARVVMPTLRHRIKLKFDWQEIFFKIEKPTKTDNIDTSVDSTTLEAQMVRMIESFCLATAPDDHEYLRIFKEEFHKSISKA